MTSDVPLLEFDDDVRAFVNPGWTLTGDVDVPTAAVACFFPRLVDKLGAGATVLARRLISQSGFFEIDHRGTRLGVFFPGMGAPLAAAVVEHVIAMGVRHVVACGSAGSLVEGLTMGHVVVVDAAVRDEGTSFHYLPPAAEVQADQAALATTTAVLDRVGAPYVVRKTWTTDAIFRETPAKVARRRTQGCITVEMEASALFAVAAWRRIDLSVLLFAGDDLSGDEWDHRDFVDAADVHEVLFELAADAAVALAATRSQDRNVTDGDSPNRLR